MYNIFRRIMFEPVWIFFQLLIYLDFTRGQGETVTDSACPHILFVAGNKDYPYVEGLYVLQASVHDNHSVYRHSCHDIYIYHEAAASTWWVGPEVGGDSGYALLYSAAASPASRHGRDTWRYWKHSEGVWLYDDDARVICLDLSCQRLTLNGEELPNKTKGSYRLTDMIHQDRPVYQGEGGGLYLYHGQVSVACNVWFLGTTVGSEQAVMFAYDKAKAPHNIRSFWTLNDRLTNLGTQGPSQKEGLNISIECIEDSMYQNDGTNSTVAYHPESEDSSGDSGENETVHEKDCGYVIAKKSQLVSQIISGRNSSFQGKWPWMVAILKSDNKTKCGAAILSSKYLITAAHCIDGSNSSLSSYQLLVGANSRASNEQHTKRYKIKRTVLHDNFTYSTIPFRLKNDVGIIEVNEEIEFTDYIRPVCLPNMSPSPLPYSNVNSPYEECYMIGFGNYHVDASGGSTSASGILQEQTVSLETISSCSRRYFSAYAWLRNSTNICVRPANYGKLCQGDSGSPLMCRHGNQWTLVGVASWSFAACISGSVPSIYVDITKHVEWITQQIGN